MSKSEYRAIALRQRCGTAVYNLLRPELPVETSTAVSTRKVNIKKPKNFQKELRKLLKEIQSSRKTRVFESGLKSDSLGTNERSEAEGKLNTKRFGKCVYSIETGGSKCKGRSRTYSNGVECKSKHFANQFITCKSTKTSDEKRKDFIKENKLAIKNIISPRRGPNHDENSISNHAIHHSSYGRIPSYLISRKKNLTNIKNVLMEATDSETYTDSIPKGKCDHFSNNVFGFSCCCCIQNRKE